SYGLEAVAALGLEPDHVFKTLVADIDGRLWLAMLPVPARLDLKALARAVDGKRARLAPVHQAERATGCVVGGISPIGHSIGAVMDASATQLVRVYVSGGRRGLDIGVAPTDLIRLTGAVIADLAGGAAK